MRELPDGNSELDGLVCTKPVIKKKMLSKNGFASAKSKLNLIRVSELREEKLP